MNASIDMVSWQEEQLPPAPGMEEIEETVGWPQVIDGIRMPSERIAFYRKVFHIRDEHAVYGVESLAEAVRSRRTSFEQQDFRILSCNGTLEDARRVVLTEIQRFLRENL